MQTEIADAAVRLRASGRAIVALAGGLHGDEARWKPAPEKWSVLEVVNHLADEEAEDFRARLDVLLHRPDEDFQPIDPPGWVTSRDYASRELAESLARFESERERSLRWLETLTDPDLDRSRVQPVAGTLSGRQMLASWVAHDLLHVRQIARLGYQRLAQRLEPISIAYAGEW